VFFSHKTDSEGQAWKGTFSSRRKEGKLIRWVTTDGGGKAGWGEGGLDCFGCAEKEKEVDQLLGFYVTVRGRNYNGVIVFQRLLEKSDFDNSGVRRGGDHQHAAIRNRFITQERYTTRKKGERSTHHGGREKDRISVWGRRGGVGIQHVYDGGGVVGPKIPDWKENEPRRKNKKEPVVSPGSLLRKKNRR